MQRPRNYGTHTARQTCTHNTVRQDAVQRPHGYAIQFPISDGAVSAGAPAASNPPYLHHPQAQRDPSPTHRQPETIRSHRDAPPAQRGASPTRGEPDPTLARGEPDAVLARGEPDPTRAPRDASPTRC
ncbi:hypothetical protein GCM10009735_20690 [Actinomadura chokoriensis]